MRQMKEQDMRERMQRLRREELEKERKRLNELCAKDIRAAETLDCSRRVDALLEQMLALQETTKS